MNKKINIEFEIANKFRGNTIDDCCEICGKEGRITFYTLESVKTQFLIIVCSQCFQILKNEAKANMTISEIFNVIGQMERR